MARKGREPKGNRGQFTFRMPSEHLDYYKAEAERCGMPLSDYFAAKLAEVHSLPEPSYVATERERIRKRDEAAARRRQREESAARLARQQETMPISA